MNRRDAAEAIAWASLAGLVVAPLLVLIATEVVLGRARFKETFGAAAFAVAFFASTTIVVAINQQKTALMRNVLISYTLKTALVLLALLVIPLQAVDRPVVALSIAFSSVVYLVVQTVRIAHRPQR